MSLDLSEVLRAGPVAEVNYSRGRVNRRKRCASAWVAARALRTAQGLDARPVASYHSAMDESTLDIDALEGLANVELARALEATLQALEKDTEILLFMGAGCAVCPHQLRSLATVALASPRVVLDVVDAASEPELAAHYEVRSVPTTVVDDELIMVGVVPPDEMALRLVERQGPEPAKRVFAALVASDRVADAAERLADGRGAEAFLEMWAAADGAERIRLMQVAEDSLLYDPQGMDPLMPRLRQGLESADEDRRADTAELLERIEAGE